MRKNAKIQTVISRSAQWRIAVAALCVLGAASLFADNLSPLGATPDWSTLDRFQESITRDDFTRLINEVYCTHGIPPDVFTIGAESVQVLANKESQAYWTLRFAKDEASRKPISRSWMTGETLPPQKPDKPLSDLRIALDPGHIGGKWAQMEERWFKIGDAPPVQEGDMTLQVAQLLKTKLEELGAKVSLVRDKLEPVTPLRPLSFRQLALEILDRAGIKNPPEDFNGPADPNKEISVRWQSELLFYRNSEIRKRAELVNKRLKPDIVLCLHFNAEAWGDPANPTLVDANHLHVLVNGAYLEPELALDDVRFEMLQRLLGRENDEEIRVANTVAETMAKITGLPPYHYKTENVTPAGTSGYVFERNLMATRLYQCPVVYLEPYVMNSKEVFERIQAGDYDGTRSVAGKERPSIFREYADSVVEGLLAHYRPLRRPPAAE